MFEARVFEEIRECWMADENNPHRGRVKKSVPKLDHFKTMIETVFVASIRREEEQFRTFSTVLLPQKHRDDEQRVSGLRQEVVVFDRRVPFVPDALQKIASACDPEISALVVSPPEDRRVGYEIWGLIFFGRGISPFNETPVSSKFTTFRPDLLTVTAVSPGSLIVSRGNGQIGRFVLGEFNPAIPTPLISRAMGRFIMSATKENSGYRRPDVRYWNVYRDALEYVLFQAAARGHGGTLIVMPESKISECAPFFESKYPMQGVLQVEELIEGIVTEERQDLVRIAYYRELEERLCFVAQLACVDGALILSNYLEPIAFGVTLKAPEWQGRVVVGPDGFGGGGESFDMKRLGTRHNSAANFIGACPHCYGFVLSQDGPIRGLVRKEEWTLYCWPDCTVSVFV